MRAVPRVHAHLANSVIDDAIVKITDHNLGAVGAYRQRESNSSVVMKAFDIGTLPVPPHAVPRVHAHGAIGQSIGISAVPGHRNRDYGAVAAQRNILTAMLFINLTVDVGSHRVPLRSVPLEHAHVASLIVRSIVRVWPSAVKTRTGREHCAVGAQRHLPTESVAFILAFDFRGQLVPRDARVEGWRRGR